MDTVMATTSCTDYNLESSDTSSPLKKKYKRIRSKAYKKRRSDKRKAQSFYKRKRLQRYLNHKTKKFQMGSSTKQMLDVPNSLVHQIPNRSQHNDETAFWKSRALSLQYENQMLYKHIEDMYSNMIISKTNTPGTSKIQEYYEDIEEYPEINVREDNYVEEEKEDTHFNEEGRKFREEREKQRKLKEQQREEEQIASQPPVKHDSKERDENMKKLYGSQWRKIKGMETVVQLNYDLTLDKQKINYWPILPIKM